ncbi:MAG: hypothetical protein AAF632_25790 [Bacteroidota bacterium]
MSLSSYLILILIIALTACGGTGEKRVMTDEVQAEMEQREIKRVMPEDITEATYQRGESLAKQLLSVLLEQYQAESSTTDFMTYLQEQSVHTFAEDATIHWVAGNTPTVGLREKEQQILEAYRYSQQQQERLIANVQRIGQDTLLYTHPVTLSDSLKAQLSLSDTDSTFLGMWSIYIPKKAIIQDM